MSEVRNTSNESKSTPLTHEKIQHKNKHELQHVTSEKDRAQSESMEKIYQTIETHAKSSEQYHAQHESHRDKPHHYITKDIKRNVYHHTIQNVQTQLQPLERRFSKIIHNDTIESLSDLGSRTIARPGAILAGGLLMVFGSLLVLLLARYYGYVVPLSLMLFLYFAGFLLFIFIEIIASPILKNRKK